MCTIGNIDTLIVMTGSSTNTISWHSLSGAIGYNIYKVSAAGDYILFQNTKETTYTFNMNTGSLSIDNFAVKAICIDGALSADFSKVARVQTGPKAIAILIIIAGILGAVILRKKSLS
jgi:hypothetical protein